MNTIELTITGMNCRSCQSYVTEALQDAAGVQSVSVNLETNTATVQGQNLNAAALVAAIEAEGYSAKLIQ